MLIYFLGEVGGGREEEGKRERMNTGEGHQSGVGDKGSEAGSVLTGESPMWGLNS